MEARPVPDRERGWCPAWDQPQGWGPEFPTCVHPTFPLFVKVRCRGSSSEEKVCGVTPQWLPCERQSISLGTSRRLAPREVPRAGHLGRGGCVNSDGPSCFKPNRIF